MSSPTSPLSGFDKTIGNFDQPVLPVADPTSFTAVRNAIEAAFSSSHVKDFMKALDRAGIRIRQFERVIDKAVLGGPIKSMYSQLGNADQGQIREFYLASLERVSPELRQKFFKLYSYY